MGGVVIMLILFGLAMVVGLFSEVLNQRGKDKYGEETWKKMQSSVRAEEEAKRYNYYVFTCPVCKSKRVRKIDNLERSLSVSALGLASDKIGKQYECDECKHKW